MRYYLALEGVDNLGKTTQAKMLVEYLEDVVRNLEPKYTVNYRSYPQYDSYVGKVIKQMLMDGTANHLDPQSMGLWFALDRYEDCTLDVLPNFSITVFNRFSLSNIIYQSVRAEMMGYENPSTFLWKLEQDTFSLPAPFYLILDGPIRRVTHREADSYETSLEFQQRLRQEYIVYALNHDGHTKLVQAYDDNGKLASKEVVHERIVDAIQPFLSKIWTLP